MYFIENSSEYLSSWIFYLNLHTNLLCSQPFLGLRDLRPNVRIYSHTEFAGQVLEITLFLAAHTHIPDMATPGFMVPFLKYSEQAATGKG